MNGYFENELVCGAEFFRYPGPEFAELRRDMDRFAADGFNYIRVQQNWAYEEPRPGKYDFSRTREIVEYAGAVGLKVILTICLENAPTWLYLGQDVYQRNAYGEKAMHTIPYPIPADGKPGPCFDNPAAVEAAERFTEAFVGEFSKYECVKGWAVWQEAHSGAMCDNRPDANYCWCEHTAAAFIKWLREKYGTLAQANRALRTNYGEWEHIMPPYAFGGTKMTPLYTEYANFLRWRIGRIAAWKRELVRRFDPQRRPVMCHTVLSMVSGQLGRYWADDYVIAKEMDVFGVSIYPSVTHGGWNDVASVMLVTDSARCAAGERTNWAAELQGGRPGSLLWQGEPPTDRDIVNWGTACIARGVKGIVWWSYREETFCQEAFGFGMLDRRGEPFEWYPEICRFDRFLLDNRDVILAAKPEKSGVAILIDHTDHILTHARDSEKLLTDSIGGIYRTLIARGVYPDFVWREQALEGRLKGYRMAFMPLPLAMSEEYAGALRDFVEGGGTLVSEAYLASYDELSNTQPEVPGCGLDALFGCREKRMYNERNGGFAGRLTGCGELEGVELDAVKYSQSLELLGGERVLTDGERTFGARNRCKEGQTFLIGTLFMQSEAGELTERLLKAAGVEFEAPEAPMVQRLKGEKGELVAVYNKLDDTAEAELPIPAGMRLRCVYGCAEEDGGSVRMRLEARSSGIAVFEKI